jgi:hypothetical protein
MIANARALPVPTVAINALTPSDTLNGPSAKAVIIGSVTSARVGTHPPFIEDKLVPCS